VIFPSSVLVIWPGFFFFGDAVTRAKSSCGHVKLRACARSAVVSTLIRRIENVLDVAGINISLLATMFYEPGRRIPVIAG
jgi:hypothetical protein